MLDATQMQQLRIRLDAREAELRARRRAADAEECDLPSEPPQDLGAQGERRIREAECEAEEERDVGELRDIAACKTRMRSGDYGLCIDCGAEIGMDRLQAQPATLRCLPCQERFDREHPDGPRLPPML